MPSSWSSKLEIDQAAPDNPQLFPEPDRILPIPIEGFRVVDRVDAPARLAALAPLVSSWVEFWYVAASDGDDVGDRHRPGSKIDPRQFKIAVGWSPTAAAAQDAMAWLMVRATAPLPAFPREGEKIGDAALGSPDGRVVYMVRGNVLVQVASVGETAAPTEMIARSADQAILSNWSNLPGAGGPQGPRPAVPPSGKSGA